MGARRASRLRDLVPCRPPAWFHCQLEAVTNAPCLTCARPGPASPRTPHPRSPPQPAPPAAPLTRRAGERQDFRRVAAHHRGPELEHGQARGGAVGRRAAADGVEHPGLAQRHRLRRRELRQGVERGAVGSQSVRGMRRDRLSGRQARTTGGWRRALRAAGSLQAGPWRPQGPAPDPAPRAPSLQPPSRR